MSHYDFLFTYSVTPNGDGDKQVELADKVRRKISKIENDDWRKLDDVETTFTGTLYLINSSINAKRSDAKNIIEAVLREAIDEHKAYREIWVNVALMVNGLGECISFRI